MRQGFVKEHLSATAGIIQDQRTGELLFFFADDCDFDRLPQEGSFVSYERDGIDIVTSVRVQLDKTA